jgi:hypothetical protein
MLHHPCALPSPEPEPSRPPPPAIAERPRWQLLHPNYGHHPTLGEHVVDPNPSPGRERRRFAGIGRSRAAPTAKGHIASPHFFPGASTQNCISNSICKLLNLVKCVENRRKFRKMKTQFFWFVVKNNTTFVILT